MRSREEVLRIMNKAISDMNDVMGRLDGTRINSIAMTSNTDSDEPINSSSGYTIAIATRDLNEKNNSAQGKQPYSISPIKMETI